MNAIVKVYYTLVKSGAKKIEDVHVSVREQVQALLDAENEAVEVEAQEEQE